MTDSQNVLVTGTSSGFGLLIAKTLAEAGHTVVATMRGMDTKNSDKAQALRDYAKERNLRVHVVELDVTDEASVAAGITTALSLCGHIDVLVNNAGVGGMGLNETFTTEQVQAIYNVNVFGVHRVVRALLPHLHTRGRGLLIHISSGLGRLVIPFLGVYGSTKFALEALAESYRYELAPLGIESVIVQPGAFGTDFGVHSMMGTDAARGTAYGPLAQVPMQMAAGMQAMLSAPNAPNPQEVADAVRKLISTPHGQRPARTVVDRINGQGPSAVNQVCEQIEQAMLTGMQMGGMLSVKTHTER
jgi:NAD(P)-dependent dehydrogenase (short-subunit alcohol dehydrogenase family)